MTDLLAALVTFLKTDSSTAALVATRVYGGELPPSEIANMPRKAIVLSRSGGGIFGGGYLRHRDHRIDAVCYGATPHEAEQVYRAVADALNQMRGNVTSGTLIHWAKPSAGGSTGRDPDTDWPVCLSSWQVYAADAAAT